MPEQKNARGRIPSYWKKGIIGGCLFFALALFLGLWIIESPPAGEPLHSAKPAAPSNAFYMDKRPILALDAGHGGKDPGAVSADGQVLEADVTCDIAARVTALLAPHANELLVVQTHSPGSYVTPKARANIASAQHANLMLSLHLNADFSAATHGFQVFPAPPGRVHFEQSTQFAELLTTKMDAAGATIMGENGIYYAYYTKLSNGDYYKALLDSTVCDPDNPSMDESFGVLEFPGCPAVLAELWHISNAGDMARFNNEDGKNKVATAIYLAICDYFALTPHTSEAPSL